MCVYNSHSHIQEGEGEEVKGVNYTREEGVRHHFEHLFCEKKVPVMEEVRKFLAIHGWIKRSETSVQDKC